MSAQQTDMFAGGESHSFSQHLDPAKVVACRIRTDVDRDHVGANEIGKFGNNATVFVFEVLGAREVVLFAESCTTMEAAECQLDHHETMLEVHRQKELFG